MKIERERVMRAPYVQPKCTAIEILKNVLFCLFFFSLGTVHILRHPPRGREGVLEKMTKDAGEGVFELDDVILKIEILEEKLSNF